MSNLDQMSNLPTKEQFEGCLIGQCLGDALGFVVEGQPPEVCREYVEEALSEGQPGARHRGRYAFGQYSDDSQLARELMQSYVTCERIDPEDYARRIAAIFSEDRIVGRGRATEEAAVRLNQGMPWQEAGTPPPSAGNGSAMRAGPVGLLFFDDLPRLAQAAHYQGVITHRDTRCSAGAVAIAGAVALALRTELVDSSEFTSKLGSWFRRSSRRSLPVSGNCRGGCPCSRRKPWNSSRGSASSPATRTDGEESLLSW